MEPGDSMRDTNHSTGQSRLAGCMLGGLTAVPDARAAGWISSRIRSFDHTVGSIVPPGFDAYARVFHPAYVRSGDREVTVRWASVAAANGREMHAAAEWVSITGSWKYQHGSTQPGVWDRAPATGRLPRIIAERLSIVLSRRMADRAHCFFGVWDGWGEGDVNCDMGENVREEIGREMRDSYDAEVAAWNRLLECSALFQMPGRQMHLLSGPLVAIGDFFEGSVALPSLRTREPPSLWWPADRSWCVATDVDLMTTYVGATTATVDALLADDELEVLQVLDAQSTTWEADLLNPSPNP